MKSILLLSGGLDSTTVVALAKSQGHHIYALSFDYGQRHRVELEAARSVAKAYEVAEHKIAFIDLRLFGHSALTDGMAVPKHRNVEQMDDIPVTYVPARNTIFLSFALAYAEVVEAENIFIGANMVDYSGYPDCRGEYLDAFEAMANLATKQTVSGKQKITIQAPLLHMSKTEIIQKGLELGVDYSKTFSCYDPTDQGEACGACDSCLLRKKGFEGV